MIFRFKKSKINNKIPFPFKQKTGQFPYRAFVDQFNGVFQELVELESPLIHCNITGALIPQ